MESLRKYAVGQRIVTTCPINYEPYTTITVHEFGYVSYVQPDDAGGGVEITWDKVHPGLKAWDNTTLLVSPELDSLVVLAHTHGRTPRWALRAVAACLIFVVGAVTFEAAEYLIGFDFVDYVELWRAEGAS